MYQTWHWFFQECWVLVLLCLDCVLMWKWSDCNSRVLGLTISKQSHWLCKKKNYGKKKKQFWGTTALSHYWTQSFSWMASTLPYGVVMNTDNYTTTTARFTWLTKVKGTNLSTQKTFQRTTREVLKDEKSSPKLLCTTLLLRTHTDALSASSRSRILSPIQLTWRCILSCTTKESQRELFTWNKLAEAVSSKSCPYWWVVLLRNM